MNTSPQVSESPLSAEELAQLQALLGRVLDAVHSLAPDQPKKIVEAKLSRNAKGTLDLYFSGVVFDEFDELVGSSYCYPLEMMVAKLREGVRSLDSRIADAEQAALRAQAQAARLRALKEGGAA